MNNENVVERGLSEMHFDNCGLWQKIWNWIAGIDINVADEEIEEAFESAFQNEDKMHADALMKIESMFKNLEGIEDSAQRFTKWQEWWHAGAKEFQRHEEKMERLNEVKARVHLAAYVKSQPFFVRPMLKNVVHKVSGGE